jgi:hypothetical protein
MSQAGTLLFGPRCLDAGLRDERVISGARRRQRWALASELAAAEQRLQLVTHTRQRTEAQLRHLVPEGDQLRLRLGAMKLVEQRLQSECAVLRWRQSQP